MITQWYLNLQLSCTPPKLTNSRKISGIGSMGMWCATCVNLYIGFIEQSDDLGVRDANISSVQSDKNGASSGIDSARGSGTNYGTVVPENSVPDRYYTGK